jgi:hypothetical protein
VSTPVDTSFETSAGVEELFAALTSDAFVERRAQRLHDGAAVVRREPRPDGGLLLSVARSCRPVCTGFLAKLLPDGPVVQTDDWGPPGPRRHALRHLAGGAAGSPARLGGLLRVEPIASGTRVRRDGNVTVSVPLVGGKAERFIAEMLGKLGHKERDLLLELIAS